MRKIFDRGITITPKRGRIAGPSAKVRTAYCLSLMLLALQAISIQSSKADMNLKLYAYNKLDWQEFQCYNWLIYKESRWNPKARNGSHYGIPQGRSVWLRDQDGYSQVRWGLSYIEHRYSTPCNALDHWKEKNWH